MSAVLKAVSLWQPWASLMAFGVKANETRGWPTRYRGWLAIHAAKRWNRALDALCRREPFRTSLIEITGARSIDDAIASLPRGAFVGVVHVVGVSRTEDLLMAQGLSVGTGREHAFGDYTAGRFAWHTDRPFHLSPPLPARGRQGLWTMDQATIAEIRRRAVPTRGPLVGVVADPADLLSPEVLS